MAAKYRDLVKKLPRFYHVLHEVHLRAHPDGHVLQVSARRRFLNGDRAAIRHILRADRITVVVDYFPNRRPKPVGSNQDIALVYGTIRTANPGAILEVFHRY